MFLCRSASYSSSGERSGVPWSGLWTVSVGVAADIVDINDRWYSTKVASRLTSNVFSTRHVIPFSTRLLSFFVM
jgi:hypothetical protein